VPFKANRALPPKAEVTSSNVVGARQISNDLAIGANAELFRGSTTEARDGTHLGDVRPTWVQRTAQPGRRARKEVADRALKLSSARQASTNIRLGARGIIGRKLELVAVAKNVAMNQEAEPGGRAGASNQAQRRATL
jgi:hypothetical protein